MNITLVYARAPREVFELSLNLDSATAAQALQSSGWADRFPELTQGRVFLSVWGRKMDPDSPLREGDRIEWCRPLRVDPKVARRERFVGQGARSSGLFAQRRSGSKAGY